jgi:hypothetical protein
MYRRATAHSLQDVKQAPSRARSSWQAPLTSSQTVFGHGRPNPSAHGRACSVSGKTLTVVDSASHHHLHLHERPIKKGEAHTSPFGTSYLIPNTRAEDSSSQGSACLLNNRCKSRLVVYCEVSQYATVKTNFGFLQAVDQLAVVRPLARDCALIRVIHSARN